MKISRYGGIIAAASEKGAFPFYKIGDTTAVQHIVTTFQYAGIFPIMVISPLETDEVRYQLSSNGVIFLQTDADELFEAVKEGFLYFQDICEKIVFAPVNAPMFSPSTLRALMDADGAIVTPSYRGKSGHPMVVSTEVIPDIVAYDGQQGLRGAVASMASHRVWVDVKDEGVLYTVHHGEVQEEHIQRHHRELIHAAAKLDLRGDTPIFDSRAKLLLLLIMKTQSVRTACNQTAISYSKAWEILNTLEASLGQRFVQRRHGGAKGGSTTLTAQGYAFLKQYQSLEEDIFAYTQRRYHTFKESLGL